MRPWTLATLVAAFVSSLAAPVVSAATSHDYSKLIVGCWLGPRKFDVYHADGTWGVKRNEDASEDIRGRRWCIEGDKLFLTFPGDDRMDTAVYTIVSCTEQKLILDDGHRQEYTRYSADCQRSNQEMKRTPKAFASRLADRRMTRLKEKLRIMKQRRSGSSAALILCLVRR